MKITDIKLRQLRTLGEVGSLEPAWDPGGQMAFTEGGGAYVEVHTDAGLNDHREVPQSARRVFARYEIVGIGTYRR